MSKYFTKRVISSVLLIVILPIVFLRLLGFLQWIEWYSYDLLFYLSPNEPRDERIVIVVWDEKDLQNSSEPTINDQTLALVLEKIKEQQPRLIGLDIYRDIPVTSRFLSDEEDEEAYNKLQEIFRSTDNLFGIEKVRKRTINPNPILKKKKHTFSSDVITDADNVIRRSFIAASSDSSYIGAALGSLYLTQDGWSANWIEKSSLGFSKNEKTIILKNLANFDGGYINNKVGRDFLVNWRKGSSQFIHYSVEDIKTGKVPISAFKNKIVLIGNISSSSFDIHRIPTSKWNKKEPYNYGVEIVAQIASSIISAGLDNRPLLRVAPWGMGYILMVLEIILTTFLALKIAEFSSSQLYIISGFFSLISSFLVLLLSLIAFQFLGWWIPIIPAIFGIWLTFFTVNYEIQLTKEKQNNLKLKVLITHLGHEVGNSTYAIEMNTEEIEVKIEDSQNEVDIVYDDLSTKNLSFINDLSLSFNELNKNFHEIKKQAVQIIQITQKLSRYKKRTEHYLKIVGFFNKRYFQSVVINNFIKELIDNLSIYLEEEYKNQIEIQQIYDPKLSKIKLDKLSVEVIISNLLENAYTTISNKIATTSNYTPKIIVKTKKHKNWIKIVVEDNGEGISKASRNKIFKLGVSGKSAGQGQGMGLFLVKGILDIERGKIRVESELGQGSKFIVLLPKK